MKIRVVGLLLLAVVLLGAGYDAEMRALQEQVGDGFTTRRSEMFLCAGNISERELASIVDGTIGRGASALWKQYFRKRPEYAIRVYLFADEPTYRAYAKKLFGDTDISHFGYYKPDQRALVMNIGTGTGTLVHEMVHALMEPDFPQAPTWFSEGLASLYEQCYIEKNGLRGLVNWRLPVLRQGMREKTTLPLARLVATKREEFLDARLGVHYAQARYFCMYLQEKGVLEKFYQAYRDGFAKDKTGTATLEKILGKPLNRIEKDWLKWVESLKAEG